MDINDNKDRYAVVKGFIDARDPSSRAIYGAFVAASTEARAIYFKSFFSQEPIEKDLPTQELVAELDRHEAEHESEGTCARCEQGLHDLAKVQGIFDLGRSRLDAKELERKLSYFCSEELQLNSIVFIDTVMMSAEAFVSTFPSIAGGESEPSSDDAGGDNDEAGQSGAQESEEHSEGAGEVFIACGPVLDTVNGTAVRNLLPGDMIDVDLPKTSLYYQFILSKDPTFSGRLDAEVTGIKLDEFGAAVVAVKIADGVYGALRISESVKLKRGVIAITTNGGFIITPEFALAAFSIVMFLLVICAILFTV